MSEKLYAMHPGFLTEYLTERLNAKESDAKAAMDLAGNIPEPGTEQDIEEIYSRKGETAHIAIDGPLSIDGADFWDRALGYGGTSYKTITAAVEKANSDPLVKDIVLNVSSPGGEVNGVWETAESIRTSQKPTTAIGSGLNASAAYWLSSQAKTLLAANPVTEQGSIGVVVAGYDLTGMLEQDGIKKVTITSARAPNKAATLETEKGQAIIQARLNDMEAEFYSAVSKGRRVTAEHIAENFGKGGLVIARSALAAGMIDGIVGHNALPSKSYADAFNQMQDFEARDGLRNNTPAQAGTREKTMTLAEFLAADPSAKIEHEQLIAQAEKNGREKAESEFKKIAAKCAGIFEVEAYKGLQSLAAKVIKGESSIDALEAAQAVADQLAEKAKSEAAQAETAAIGAVKGQAPDLSATPESKAMDDAGMQALEEAKRRKEAQGKWQ